LCYPIKGLRWLLLHRRDNLEKDAARRLKRGLTLNAPLQCGYLLKVANMQNGDFNVP
jgi:hypothetical protein